MNLPNFTQGTMHNYRLVGFFLSILLLLGIFTLWTMPKQEFPEFSPNIGIMVAVNPGASAEEMERTVTNRLEDYAFTFSEVDRSRTNSQTYDGICVSYIFLDEETPDVKAVWGRMRDGLPMLQKTVLPASVLGVEVLDIISSAAAELIVLDSDDKTYSELISYIDDLRSRLQDVPKICNLAMIGGMYEQISIYLDKERMVRYGINRNMITTQLTLQGYTTGGAHAENDNVNLPIYVNKTFSSENELSNQIIYSDPRGEIIRLKDVARVVREYPDITTYINNNGRLAVILSREMKQGGDIITFGNEVNSIMEEFEKELPSGVRLTRVADQPKVVKESIYGFGKDLLEAIIIVVLVMMILFPLRSALVAGMSIPVTIIITFCLMGFLGIPLNNVTLATLIVALGMVVDDSIIIIDSHRDLLKAGHSRWYSSVMSAHKLFPSISLATVSICLVFVPTLIYLPKMLLDIFNGFTMTLICSLMASLFIAMILVPLLNHRMLGRSYSDGSRGQNESKLLVPVQRGYDWLLRLAFRHANITLISCVLLVVAGGWLFSKTPIRMMPTADRDQFIIEVHTPNSASIDYTAAITDTVCTVMKQDERIVDATEFVGLVMPRFMATSPVKMGNKHFSQIIVRTTSSKTTLDVVKDYTGYFNKRWPGTYVSMKQLTYSLASGMGVTLVSDNTEDLCTAADTIQSYLESLEEVSWVHNPLALRIPAVEIDLNPISASQMGITRLAVQTSMAMKYGGLKTGSIWDDDRELPVMIYTADRDERRNVGAIGDEYVGGMLSKSVPLRQVATISPEWKIAEIPHFGGRKGVCIMGDIHPKYNSAAVQRKLKDYLEGEFQKVKPESVTLREAGDQQVNKLLGEPLMKSFAMSLFIILLIMVINFKRFRLSLLAMFGTMLALPGAALGMWLSGLEFGVIGMLGVFSLLGIVMRNSIIMFDHAEELCRKGYTACEAAMEAGKRRMTPIFLTSATTAVGVLPLIFSKSTLWPPMGWIICIGTLSATLLVVTVMPVAYWKVMEKEYKKLKPRKVSAIVMLALCLMSPASLQAQNIYTLQEAKTTAYANNIELKKQQIEVRKMNALKKELYTRYFPNVTGSAAMWARDRGLFKSDLLDLLFSLITFEVYDEENAEIQELHDVNILNWGVNAGITLVQPIYAGGKITTANRLAELGVKAQEEITILKGEQLEAEVEKYFWQLVQLYEAERSMLTMDTLVANATHDAALAFKAGLVTSADKMQVDLYASELKSTRLQIQNGKELCLEYLAYLMGVESVDSIVWDDIYAIEDPLSYLVDTHTSVESRHETQLLHMNLKAAELKKRLTLSKSLPTVSLALHAGYHYWSASNENGIFHNYFDKHPFGLTSIINVSVPLTEWWAGKHSLRRANLNINKARMELEDKQRLMSVQVKQKWSTLNERYKQIEIARQTHEQAKALQHQQAVAYRSGAITMTDRLLADAQYEKTRNKYIESCINYRMAVTEYLLATGR
ncbi:MAG: efflux RND transporter permease subunit [Prevotellaceae bacterium]|nr:efflux RND transporter permease subunit [Prevotellaceae bacterium]